MTKSFFSSFPISAEERVIAYDRIKNQIVSLNQQIHTMKNQELSSRFFEDMLGVFISGQRQLDQDWFLLVELNELRNIPALRETHSNIAEQLNDFYTQLSLARSLSKILYQFWDQQEEHSEEKKKLFKAFRKLLPKSFEKNNNELASLLCNIKKHVAKIENNIATSTSSWRRILSVDEMRSMSEKLHQPFIDCFNFLCPEKNHIGYAMTLEERYVNRILRYSSNRQLRQEVFEAFQKRCTEKDTRLELDNTFLIKELFEMRQQVAILIQKESYFHYTIEHNMIRHIGVLNEINRQLTALLVNNALKQVDTLTQLAHENGMSCLEPWDLDYLNQQHLKTSIGFDSLEIRRFFTFKTVWTEMLAHFSQLYGLIFESENNVPKWHDDVLIIKTIDAQSLEVLGIIYCDVFARNDKHPIDSTSTMQPALLTTAGVWEPAILFIRASFEKDSHDFLFFNFDFVS